MSKMKQLFTVFLWITILILTACSSQQEVHRPENFAHQYNPATKPLEIQYLVFHASEDITQLYFSVNTASLGFLPLKDQSETNAYLQLKLALFQLDDSTRFIDSLQFQVKIPKSSQEVYISNIPLKLREAFRYRIHIQVLDRFNNTTNQQVIIADKKDLSSPQNYMVRLPNYLPVFSQILEVKDSLLLESRFPLPNQIWVQFTNPGDFHEASPFGTSLDIRKLMLGDSTYSLTNNDPCFLKFKDAGFYTLKTSEKQPGGMMFQVIDSHYPKFKTPEELLKPLKYLLSAKEYRNILESANPKQSLDSFWLSLNNDLPRAKELIRIYYNRAETANTYFSSILEGWDTDRGMIYIIFGPPRTVLKAEGEERWIYGDTNLPSLDFTFVANSKVAGLSEYVLVRQEVYKASWYQAVDSWRNGRAYSIY